MNTVHKRPRLLPTLRLASIGLLLSGCLHNGPATRQPTGQTPLAPMQVARFELLDSSRQRIIPVTAYYPAAPGSGTKTQLPKLRLALLSHGYGIRNTRYAFVAQNLVAHGYYVASLQHDLPSDVPIPRTGEVHQTRYPYWKRGAENLTFAIQALKRRNPALAGQPVLLMGHSYGGDIVAFFAQEHPAMVQKIITFDNCRVPLPRTPQPQLLSLRSSDQVADPGVLPTLAEQEKLGMTVIQLPATRHGDMCDHATTQQKHEMNKWISVFLETP